MSELDRKSPILDLECDLHEIQTKMLNNLYAISHKAKSPNIIQILETCIKTMDNPDTNYTYYKFFIHIYINIALFLNAWNILHDIHYENIEYRHDIEAIILWLNTQSPAFLHDLQGFSQHRCSSDELQVLKDLKTQCDDLMSSTSVIDKIKLQISNTETDPLLPCDFSILKTMIVQLYDYVHQTVPQQRCFDDMFQIIKDIVPYLEDPNTKTKWTIVCDMFYNEHVQVVIQLQDLKIQIRDLFSRIACGG